MVLTASRARRGLAAACAALLLTPWPGAAQAAAAARGWIGVSVDVRTSFETDGRTRSVAVVEGVGSGSPAARAGLRPGDILVSVNGRPYDLGFPELARTLRPGDTVRMVVSRQGRTQELELVAADRPTEVASGAQWSLRMEVDSVAESMFRAMDSLRVELVRADSGAHVLQLHDAAGRTTVIRRLDGAAGAADVRRFEVRVGSPFDRRTGQDMDVRGLGGEEVRPPFGFFLFGGARHDSLTHAMERLNEELREVRLRERERLRDLGLERSVDGRGLAGADAELQALQRQREVLARRSTELRRAMEMAAVEAARAPGAPGVLAWRSDDGERATTLRPLSPYLLGQNRAAGAEVVDLRPELADYFQVDRGVLVVDVPQGTPAALAGLQPGDVITRVGGRTVASIVDLREGLAGSGPEAAIALVRKGRSLEVLLRR